MSTASMFWAAAAYNNGILPNKHTLLGEVYDDQGNPARIDNPVAVDEDMLAAGIRPFLVPLPTWQVVPSPDIWRALDPGGAGRGLDVGQPLSLRPGEPDLRGTRARGTGGRVSGAVMNLHKTRLNDPMMWFMGTNERGGDFRSSGCSGCHVVYANDRDPRHSGPWAWFGHDGESFSEDPTIPREESGHPVRHTFTRAIPTSQCMVCHMHQPNIFLNSFLGYTMWDYESDGAALWPEEQDNPTLRQRQARLDANPEGAVATGSWHDPEVSAGVSELNPELEDTQFADYHGHGWNFRAIHKRDREGQLLDVDNEVIEPGDEETWDKAVHMSSVHVDVGMHCVDCHWSQDAHGDGHIYGEVPAAIEVTCEDCHGTASAVPNLLTSGPAAPEGGNDMGRLLTPDGAQRFVWRGDSLFQRSALWPDKEWELSLVAQSVDPEHEQYNAKAARAKLMSDDGSMSWGPGVATLAHDDEQMECYTCHLSWTTSCAGCHLPTDGRIAGESHHFEGGRSKGYASYNPQAVREDMFQLGIHADVKGNTIAPVRSSSAVMVSVTNDRGERTVEQQPTISAAGFSSQAFAPHFPHTVRKEETKTCTDCHLSDAGDNNAWMAQLLLQGTGFVDFMGHHVMLGTEAGVEAVEVTEWDEPQAVLGSTLHGYAYPANLAAHQASDGLLPDAATRSGPAGGCVAKRGEWLFVAQPDGLQVLDVSGVGNIALSERITAGRTAWEQLHVPSSSGTCVALPTTQPIRPVLNTEALQQQNHEQPFHDIYHYAVLSDSVEGLVLVNVDALVDGDERSNRLQAALRWDAGGQLAGAHYVVLGGSTAYVLTNEGLVLVDLTEPMSPRVLSSVPLDDPRGAALQFRYLLVSTADGLVSIDVTDSSAPRVAGRAALQGARRLSISRTWAYVATDAGLALVDIGVAEQPRVEDIVPLAASNDVAVGSTNASLFGYVATDEGLVVLQLTGPESHPAGAFYGFSPTPVPVQVGWWPTRAPALSIARGLERDRAVDETGGQVAVLGRIGSRPFTRPEMETLYVREDAVWTVNDAVDEHFFVAAP
jgi:hypothetical protein